MRRWLCALLGGHQVRGPVVVAGKLRLTCAYGCGWHSQGVETLGQERIREKQARRVVGFAIGARHGGRQRCA